MIFLHQPLSPKTSNDSFRCNGKGEVPGLVRVITDMRLSQGDALCMHGSVVTVLRHLPGMNAHCITMFTFRDININYSYALKIFNTWFK